MNRFCLQVLFVFCWLACPIVVAQQSAVSSLADADGAKAGPVFDNGLAQVVPAFKNNWIQHDLWVETDFDSDQDGANDRMHVAVCRQQQTDTEGLKVPVIYNTSPYFTGVANGGKETMWDPRVELNVVPPRHDYPAPIPQQARRPQISRQYVSTWVPRGFAVVHSSSPGTGLSDGCPSCGGDNEALAPKAVIDWLCGRRNGYTSAAGNETVDAYWCSGKVGMMGASYEGTLPIAAATTGVDGLEVIVPEAPNTSYYHYYRSHGLVRHPGGYMGEDIDVLYDFVHSGDEEMRDTCNRLIRDGEMASHMDRVTGDYNDFWAGRDYLNKLQNYKTPTLLVHGLSDWNVMPGHSIRLFTALKQRGVPCKLALHQAGHGAPPNLKLKNAWFSHYLYGVDNGVSESPRLSVVRENARLQKATQYADYPNPAAQPVTFYLTPPAAGSAGGLKQQRSVSGARQTLVDNAEVPATDLAQAVGSPHRLIYTTRPLAEPLHISGTCKVTIKLACNKPAANLSVWLLSSPWETKPRTGENGRSRQIRLSDNLITRGWADPQNHGSLNESQPLATGEFYTVTFTLEPDDQIVAAGQKIGLMIFSSDRDFTLWPQAGTELTVDLDGTELEIPVVGGAAAIKLAK